MGVGFQNYVCGGPLETYPLQKQKVWVRVQFFYYNPETNLDVENWKST